MGALRVVMRELLHYRWNAVAGLASVTLAVAAVVATGMILAGHEADAAGALSEKRARLESQLAHLRGDIARAMGELGFNLTILPKGQQAADWYAQGESTPTMPEDDVLRLAEGAAAALRNVTGQLRRRVTWPERNWPVVVVGRGMVHAPGQTVAAAGDPKAIVKEPVPLAARYVKSLPAGTVALGYELHGVFKLREGDSVEFMGRGFRVARCLPQEGNRDDLAMFMPLADAQTLLNQPGQISEIIAQGVPAALENPPELQRLIARVLPGVEVVQSVPATVASKMATTHTHRNEQARMEREEAVQADLNRFRRRLAGAVSVLVVASCSLWIAWLAWSNVAERRVEIGIWLACGLRVRRVAAIFLGRWLLLGALGATAGFAVAWAVVLVSGESGTPWQPEVLAAALAIAMLLSGVAAGIAALAATREDPAIALRSG
ncbi:MAG: FtsX-like permease family protein [Patescibacteria group bacterium]|nr:FtsX-like permease family protein [Patescibacteria group bacterium]